MQQRSDLNYRSVFNRPILTVSREAESCTDNCTINGNYVCELIGFSLTANVIPV